MKQLKLKRSPLYLAILGAAAVYAPNPVMAAEFDFHGDMNNRFKAYTNQRDWFRTGYSGGGTLKDSDPTESYGEIKYRFWFTAASDDGMVKGVYATEIGGIRFGEGSGGDFSGDGVNVETRWAYVDFALPGAVDQRLKIGLQPVSVNANVWNETATAAVLTGKLQSGIDYQLLWGRGDSTNEDANDSPEDEGWDGADNFALNLDKHFSPNLNAGIFYLYQMNNQVAEGVGDIDSRNYELKLIADNSEYSVSNLGATFDYNRETSAGRLFLKGTAIAQTGTIEGVNFNPINGAENPNTSYDLSTFLGRGELGLQFGPNTVTYTMVYASGDSNEQDSNFDAFISTDVDLTDSMIFQENFMDDDYFAETPYILDKGYFLNKIQLDHKVRPNLKLSGMLVYNRLAEAITLADGSSSKDLGLEFGGRVSYLPYPSLEIAAEAAYLLAGDAVDVLEEGALQNGQSDKDIVHVAGRVRYKF